MFWNGYLIGKLSVRSLATYRKGNCTYGSIVIESSHTRHAFNLT